MHITYLDRRSAGKAKVAPDKRMLGECKGKAIWLGDYSTHMLCTEGIEKGLALQHATGIPCAVGMSATLLPSIVWPEGTQLVTLCADPNIAGEAAINKLGAALAEAGIQLFCCYPPADGKDWDECPAEAIKAQVETARPWAAPRIATSVEATMPRPAVYTDNVVPVDFSQPKPAQAEADDGRPLVRIVAGEAPPIADEAEAHLIAACVPFYQRGNRLVRPIIDTMLATQGRETRSPRLVLVEDVYMRETLARHIRWEKFDKRANAGCRSTRRRTSRRR